MNSVSDLEARVISTFQASSGGSAASSQSKIWEIKREQKKMCFIPDPDLVQNFTLIILISLTIWITKFWKLLLALTFKFISILQHFIDFSDSSMTGSDHLYLPEPCRLRGLLDLPTGSADIRCLPNPLKAPTIPWPTVWAVDQILLLPVRRKP